MEATDLQAPVALQDAQWKAVKRLPPWHIPTRELVLLLQREMVLVDGRRCQMVEMGQYEDSGVAGTEITLVEVPL